MKGSQYLLHGRITKVEGWGGHHKYKLYILKAISGQILSENKEIGRFFEGFNI